MSKFALPSQTDTLPTNKVELRQEMRRRRQALHTSTRQQAQQKIADILIQHPLIQSAKTLAGYAAFDGEVDLSTFYQKWQSMQADRTVLYPIHTRHQALKFYRADRWSHTHHNYATPIGPHIDSQTIEVMLVPGLAFDAQGQRLGFGGGYYDRTLKQLRDQSWRGYVIGVAFLLQSLPSVPHTEWDQPVTALVNEMNCYTFTSNDP